MKIKDVRSIIDLIRDASKADLIIVSLFLLPILLGSWSICFNNISYLDHYDGSKFAVMIVIAAIYILGLIVMKWCDPRDEQLKRARLHVERRLERRPGHRASFEAIRKEVNEKYDDNFLKELINKNPATFHKSKVRRSKGKPYMDGIALN
jgi:hypothetical protein